MQLQHHNSRFAPRKFPIILICDNVTSPANIGGVFRIADAFGVEKIVFCGEAIEFTKRTTKVSRSTEKTMAYETGKDGLEILTSLREASYMLISLEITAESKSIKTLQIEKEQAVALVVGGENYGISKENLALSDVVIHIPMYGNNSSMNLVQATSIALFEITNKMG